MGKKDRLRHSFSKDRQTLKDLNWRQRFRFCLDYYKGYLFLLIVAALMLFYLGDLVLQSRQTIVLQGFFLNDGDNRFPAGKLADDFSRYLKLPPNQRIAFEDSLFVDLDSSSEYTAASQSKIVAYISSRELDFLVAPKGLAEYYARSFSLYDLNDLLPNDLTSLLKDDFYYAKDGTGTEKACGINLCDSSFMDGADPDQLYYLLVLSYSPRTEAMVAFLRYAYDLNK